MTALGLGLDPGLCRDHVLALAGEAGRRGLGIELDMEDSSTTDATLEIYRAAREAGHDNVLIALQAYLRRTEADLEALMPLEPRVRVVKGIWVEPPALAYSDREEIRRRYLALVERLVEGGAFVAVASHDAWIHEHVLALLGERPDARYEFQMLLGVTEQAAGRLAAAGHPLRVYVPYGADWYAYSVRRFQENPEVARQVAGDVVRRLTRR